MLKSSTHCVDPHCMIAPASATTLSDCVYLLKIYLLDLPTHQVFISCCKYARSSSSSLLSQSINYMTVTSCCSFVFIATLNVCLDLQVMTFFPLLFINMRALMVSGMWFIINVQGSLYTLIQNHCQEIGHKFLQKSIKQY